MSFRILGPLEVWDGDRRLAVSGPQKRALLAVLLLNANRVVSIDRLVEHLWGPGPPANARRLLHGCVAQLRRTLRTGHASGQPLVTHPPGYLLEVRPDELDLHRFDELTAAACRIAGQPSVTALEQAGELLTEALSMWRGPALDGVVMHGRVAETAPLEERRLAALEDRIDIDLRLGRHQRLAGELQVLVRSQPLRERFWAQLMVALYASHRQADALAAYHKLRAILVDQVGVEPGTLLQHLQQVVLSGGDAVEVYLKIKN